MKKLFNILLVLIFALSLVPYSVSAAPMLQEMACEQDAVVQADDWLSKLSDKFYGDVLAFPAIVEATNQQNAADDSYARIVNPDTGELCPTGEIGESVIAIVLAPLDVAWLTKCNVREA